MNKSIAQVKAETELTRLKLMIPMFNNLTRTQEEYIVLTLRLTFEEGELEGFRKAGSILIK